MTRPDPDFETRLREIAIRALFGERPFEPGPHDSGERDCYAISIPAFVRALSASYTEGLRRAVQAIAAAERELNDIRDTMLNDRSFYDGLIHFAGDVEGVAASLRTLADEIERRQPKDS